MRTPETSIFEIDSIDLQFGGSLTNARLAYTTWGKLNSARDNVVLFPTFYTGTHTDNATMIDKGRALDTDKYFIIVPNMFGNGVSSSPSNTPVPYAAADFPGISVLDNVICQQRLLEEVFGIKSIKLVIGWSMGAMQAYQWGAAYPDQVQNMLCICGSARISPHNRVFLDGVESALRADQQFNDGRYIDKPVSGLKAFARVYAGWAYSQAFYRDGLYKDLGFTTTEELLLSWENDHLVWDANDLLAMLWTWKHADIGNTPGMDKDFNRALASITARSVIMPCTTDLYFTVADNAYEVEHLPHGELRVIESDWGHIAGRPDRVPEVSQLIDATIMELLEARS